MKQFIVDRETTPETPALDPVAIPKVPVYDTVADAEADLANLAEGQIIATEDTGAELNVPVDTVEDGNMHAVTSNAVADYTTQSILDNIGNYKDLNITSSFDIRNLETGYWRANSTVNNLLLYKPTWYEGGITYIIVGKTSDENFIIFISPRSSKISVIFQYGNWGSWINII